MWQTHYTHDRTCDVSCTATTQTRIESWRRNPVDKSLRLFARFTRRGKTTTRSLSTKLSNFKRGCLSPRVHKSPNNALAVRVEGNDSVLALSRRSQCWRAVWNSCSSVFMKSKVMLRCKETRLVACLLLFLTLSVDLGFAFGRNKDTEFTFLLPPGATECFFQTATKNGSMEVEYQVNNIFKVFQLFKMITYLKWIEPQQSANLRSRTCQNSLVVCVTVALS